MIDSLNLQKHGMFTGGAGARGVGGPFGPTEGSKPSVTPAPPTVSQLPPDQHRKMMLAKMLMSGGMGAGAQAFGPMSAIGMMVGGMAQGYANNPKNSDQGYGSWAPTISQ